MDWHKVKLGEVLLRRRDSIKVLPDEEYKLVTIKLYHKGVTLRSKVKGLDVKSSMSKIKTGDFILSGIDARNGAFGIVPQELDGAIVTNDFWCLDPDENRISKDFLLFLTTTNFFDNICKQSSDGTTQRIRLQKDKFFNYSIFLPSVEDQIILTKQFKKLKYESLILKDEFQHQLSLVKQLRQAFLSEAMQGKLVTAPSPQERAGGEATSQQLLARIKAEKAQLIKDKKLKKEKELPPIEPEEIPFEIPKDWVWCRLGEICSKIGSGSTPKGSNYSVEGKPFFRSQNIHDNGLVFSDIKYVSDDVQRQMNGTIVLPDDLLLNITGGSLGRCALVPNNFEEGNVSQHVCIIRSLEVNNIFMHKLVLSPYFQKLIFSSTTGAGREGLPKYNLEQFIIPLPPLSTQNQIVAKLDELMKTCDDLETSIKQSQIQNEQLLQQVLKEALEVREEEIA